MSYIFSKNEWIKCYIVLSDGILAGYQTNNDRNNAIFRINFGNRINNKMSRYLDNLCCVKIKIVGQESHYFRSLNGNESVMDQFLDALCQYCIPYERDVKIFDKYLMDLDLMNAENYVYCIYDSEYLDLKRLNQEKWAQMVKFVMNVMGRKQSNNEYLVKKFETMIKGINDTIKRVKYYEVAILRDIIYLYDIIYYMFNMDI